MPAYYRVALEPDGQMVGWAGLRGNLYLLPDGETITLNVEPAYCRSCRQVVHGEALPTLGEIDRLLADRVADLDRHGVGSVGAIVVREAIAEARRQRRWLEGRVSPAKCLRCGSTDIVFLPVDRSVPHPEGMGTIRLHVAGMCDSVTDGWTLTSEGDRIGPLPRDRRPSTLSLSSIRRWIGRSRG